MSRLLRLLRRRTSRWSDLDAIYQEDARLAALRTITRRSTTA